MSAAALALLMLTGTFQAEWSAVAGAYTVPALVLTIDELGGDGLAVMEKVDQAGAHITVDPDLGDLTPVQIRKTAAHEAFHAMLRARGVPYMNQWEEQLANAFAFCWLGDAWYIGVVDCPSILASVR